MNLNKVGASSAINNGFSVSKTRNKSAELSAKNAPGKDTGDNFKPSDKTSPEKSMKNLSGIAGRVLNAKGLEKSKYHYRVKSQAHSSDGNTYIAYTDYSKSEGNYISSVSPDGKIQWEITTGPDGLNSIHTGPDGTLFARTDKTLMGYNPDGSIRFRHEFENEIQEHFIDKQGNNLFRERSTNNLIMVDKEGNKTKIPLKLRGLSPSEIKPQEDGTFLMRQGRKVHHVDMKAGKILKTAEFIDPDSKMARNILEFENTSDGGTLLTTQQVTSVNNHAFHADLHMGLGFGRRFGGHIPPDYDMSYNTVTSRYLVKLDSEGKIDWISKNLGSDTEVTLLADDSALYKGDYSYSQKKSTLKKVTPKGEVEDFATIDGGPVSGIHYRKSDDRVFAELDSKITILSSDGKIVKEFDKTGGEKEKLSIRSFDPQGNVIMQNSSFDSLFRWDPDTDTLTPLTNHNMDYSYKTAKFEELPEDVDNEKLTIEKEENYIVIGGVKVPVKKP